MVTKYSNLLANAQIFCKFCKKWSNAQIIKTELKSLEQDRVAFEVCNYRDRILYVTGGSEYDKV